MADSIQLSDEVLKSVARQVGDRIAEEYASAPDAVPPDAAAGAAPPTGFSPLSGVDVATARFKLAETFEVWRLKEGAEDGLASTTEDLVTLARPTGTYRHLIRVSQGGTEKAVAFAQSALRGPGANDAAAPDLPFAPSVRDFYFSPLLAGELDEAVTAADQQVPEDAVVRLLSLPEFKVEALWFVTTAEAPGAAAGAPPTLYITTRGVIVASAPASFSGQKMSLITSAAFVKALSGTSRGMGLIF